MVKKQTFIRVISFLSVVIIIMGIFAIKEYNKSQKYMLLIENQYSRAFGQLNSSLNNISIAVEKTLYATSAKKISLLAAEIFSEAELAKVALSELPNGNNTSIIYKFLSQVGNYVLSISKNITSENSVTEKQREELRLLKNTAKTVTQIINDSEIEYNTPEQWAQAVENKLNNVVNENDFTSSLNQLEDNLSDYPTLIYDGPYSDHILEKEPLMTSVAKECSKEQALNIAKSCVGKNINLGFEQMQSGKIECYRFSGSSVDVAVSKKGGYVVYMRKSRQIGEQLFSYSQALSRATKFLDQMGINNMMDTYFYTDNGVCVINFAYLDGQTICYTDLIKVGVAMDTGEIMFFETAGYLTNHTNRAFSSLETTPEQAMNKISSDLDVKQYSIALIPTNSGAEVRCYEFLCEGDNNQEILVYINAHTLQEEQIYILLKSDGGTLVK